MNGYLKYIFSGILLVLVFASFTYTTMIYKDLSIKLDNHLLHIEQKIDDIKKDVCFIKERLARIETCIKR